MKALRVLLSALLLTLAVSSCNFDFLTNADLGKVADSLKLVKTAIDGGVRYSYYTQTDVLVYYEDHFVDSAGRTVQTQRYAADDTLSWVYTYGYDTDGNQTLVAYYNGAKELQWYQGKVWQDGKIVSITEYKAGELRQWTRHYQYAARQADETTDRLNLYAELNGSGEVTGGYIIEYNAELKPLIRTNYSASGRSLRPAFATGSSRAIFDLPAPQLPAEVPSCPSPEQLAALGVSGYVYWFYDSFGQTELEFDSAWYPLSASRTDSRIQRPVSVSLEWQDGRIAKKRSYYGPTLALEIGIEYNAGGFPALVTSSGAAMLLPLDYAIQYDANNIPGRVDVSSGGDLLHYFVITYAGPALTLDSAPQRGFDPFTFADQLTEPVLRQLAQDAADQLPAQVAQWDLDIQHFDGDNTLLETFAFGLSGNSLRADVLTPDGTLNGYYQRSVDTAQQATALGAYSADGTAQWSYSFSRADAEFLTKTALPDTDFGRLAEYWLTDEMADYAKGFIMDFLF